MGRQNWAAEVKRAYELDPLSMVIGDEVYVVSGQYDLAMEIQRKRQELDPDCCYLGVGHLYTLKGMYPEAIAQFQKAVDLSGGAPGALSALGYTYGLSGKRAKALKILQQLTLLSRRRYVPPYDIARVYVGLGEKDRAFDWLEKAVANRSIALPELRYQKELDSIRSDPRYSELIRRIGLPP